VLVILKVTETVVPKGGMRSSVLAETWKIVTGIEWVLNDKVGSALTVNFPPGASCAGVKIKITKYCRLG